MRVSPLVLLLCVGVLGCGSETKPAKLPSVSTQAVTEFNKGVEFAEQGDYDTAIACYTEAIRIDLSLAVAYYNRGMAYYKGEEYGDAGMAFDNFAKLFPDDTLTSDALFWAGESYRQGNQNSLAFRRYNRCRWDFPVSEAAKGAQGVLGITEKKAVTTDKQVASPPVKAPSGNAPDPSPSNKAGAGNNGRGRGGAGVIFRLLDTDRDGQLSSKEIDNAVANLKKLDKNKDGILSAEELRIQGDRRDDDARRKGERGNRNQSDQDGGRRQRRPNG